MCPGLLRAASEIRPCSPAWTSRVAPSFPVLGGPEPLVSQQAGQNLGVTGPMKTHPLGPGLVFRESGEEVSQEPSPAGPRAGRGWGS